MWKRLVDIAVVGTFILTLILVIQGWQHPFALSLSISHDRVQLLSVIAMLAAAVLNYSTYRSRFRSQASRSQASQPDEIQPTAVEKERPSEKPLADRVGGLAHDLLQFLHQCGPWEPSLLYADRVNAGFMEQFDAPVEAMTYELTLSGFSDVELFSLLSKDHHTWHDIRKIAGLLLAIRTKIELQQLEMSGGLPTSGG